MPVGGAVIEALRERKREVGGRGSSDERGEHAAGNERGTDGRHDLVSPEEDVDGHGASSVPGEDHGDEIRDVDDAVAVDIRRAVLVAGTPREDDRHEVRDVDDAVAVDVGRVGLSHVDGEIEPGRGCEPVDHEAVLAGEDGGE